MAEFEREYLLSEKSDFFDSLRIFEAMWKEGVTLGVLPPEDPLEGIEVDLPGYSTMFEDLLRKIALALKAAGLPYMIIGGQAVLLYGNPRLTRAIIVKNADYDREYVEKWLKEFDHAMEAEIYTRLFEEIRRQSTPIR